MVTAFVLISVEDCSVHETVKTLLPVHGITEMHIVAGDYDLVAVNHFSHNGGGSHQELADHFRPLGIEVCHDGMTLER